MPVEQPVIRTLREAMAGAYLAAGGVNLTSPRAGCRRAPGANCLLADVCGKCVFAKIRMRRVGLHEVCLTRGAWRRRARHRYGSGRTRRQATGQARAFEPAKR